MSDGDFPGLRTTPLVRVDPAALDRYLAASECSDRELEEALDAAEHVLPMVVPPELRHLLAAVREHLVDLRAHDEVVRQTSGAVRALVVSPFGATVRPSVVGSAAAVLAVIHRTAGAPGVLLALGNVPRPLRGPSLRTHLLSDDATTVRALVGELHHEAWGLRPHTPEPAVGSENRRALRTLAQALSDAFEGSSPQESALLLDSVGDPVTLTWLVDEGLQLPTASAVAAFRSWYAAALVDRARMVDPVVGIDVPHRAAAFEPGSAAAAVPESLLDLVTRSPGGPANLSVEPHVIPSELRKVLGLDAATVSLLELVDLPVPTVDNGAATARLLESLARTGDPLVAATAATSLLRRATGKDDVAAGALGPAAALVATHHLADLANALGLPMHRRSGPLEIVDGVLALDGAEAADLVGRALVDPVVAPVLLAPLTERLAERALTALAGEDWGVGHGDNWLRSLIAFDHAIAVAAHRELVTASTRDPEAVAWRTALIVVDVGTAIAAVTGHLPSALRAPAVAPFHAAEREARSAPDAAVAGADAVGMGCHQLVALGLASGRLEPSDPLVRRLDVRFLSEGALRPWWTLTSAERATFVHIATAHTASFEAAGLPTPGDVASLHAQATVVAS